MDLSYAVDDTTLQRDLFGLFPGAAGGRATRDRYGHVYLRDLGQRGSRITRDRYGLDYLRELARRGGIAKRVKGDCGLWGNRQDNLWFSVTEWLRSALNASQPVASSIKRRDRQCMPPL
jgi:hypothetical protein